MEIVLFPKLIIMIVFLWFFESERERNGLLIAAYHFSCLGAEVSLLTFLRIWFIYSESYFKALLPAAVIIYYTDKELNKESFYPETIRP